MKKNKLIKTIFALTPALAIVASSCGNAQNNTSHVHRVFTEPKSEPKKTDLQIITDTVEDTKLKLENLTTTSKSDTPPLMLNEEDIYSENFSTIFHELGVKNIEIPGNLVIKSIDWDPVYVNNKLKVYNINNQKKSAIKVSMELYMEESSEEYSSGVFSWEIKGFKLTDKENLTVDDWKKTYPHQAKFLYEVPSASDRNSQSYTDRFDAITDIFVSDDCIEYKENSHSLKDQALAKLYTRLQNEYNDFNEGDILLKFNAFNLMNSTKKLPNHLWIQDDIKLAGWGLFADKIIPGRIRLPKNMKKINDFMFYKSIIKEGIILPDSIVEISRNAFEYSNIIMKFNLPVNLQVIKWGGFWKAKIPIGFTIPIGVTLEELSFSVYGIGKQWDRETKDHYPLPGSVFVGDN